MISIIIAFVLGAWFGIFIMCCMFVAKEADERQEKLKGKDESTRGYQVRRLVKA